MPADLPIRYTLDEIRSFLPTGWTLAGENPGVDGTEGAWDPKQRTWRMKVRDGVEFEYPVVVKSDDVAALGANGRIEALRRAFDKLNRERLG